MSALSYVSKGFNSVVSSVNKSLLMQFCQQNCYSYPEASLNIRLELRLMVQFRNIKECMNNLVLKLGLCNRPLLCWLSDITLVDSGHVQK